MGLHEPINLRERLASIEHDRWGHWQSYLHSRCTRNADGTLTIPAELVTRWERQIATGYDDLLEAEKDSDRLEADKTLAAIRPDREFVSCDIDAHPDRGRVVKMTGLVAPHEDPRALVLTRFTASFNAELVDMVITTVRFAGGEGLTWEAQDWASYERFHWAEG